MSPQRVLAFVAVVALAGCAHRPLSGSDLNRVKKPAFVSRIEEDAGPQSRVFREDGKYHPKLKKLDPAEADRRLSVKLGKAMSRFEVADRLRASIWARLPREKPWTEVADPARVASVLESYLVDEVPANPPDFDLLRPLGVDAAIEIVIHAYGMRSEGGGAYAFVEGYARMFWLDGGEMWRAPFRVDGKKEARQPQDPFLVAREPEHYRAEMVALIDKVSEELAKELTPPSRRPEKGMEQGGSDDLSAPPDDTNRLGREPRKPAEDELPPGELPPPDPVPSPKG